ncbi:MAG: hypothetical protein Pg6C_20310 [Treponemataceae bacterium]|nr:MAG: hypothetical protein Pg6C_20310 [Treponemataceae bacterium]
MNGPTNGKLDAIAERTLVSADDKLLKLSWPGLQTIHIASFSIS